MINTAAVVVTYNRKELLLECVAAIQAQSLPVRTIIIIDNSSTDGTFDLLEQRKIFSDSRIIYKRLDKNIGGAGGFNEGMAVAKEHDSDWIWIMDDDTVPDIKCHENAIASYENLNQVSTENISFLASTVYSVSGGCLNATTVDYRPDETTHATGWFKYLYMGVVRVSSATFVSIFIPKDAVSRCGLPVRDYFIWGDDVEYTTRLTRYFGPAYVIGASKAVHKCKIANKDQFFEEKNDKRIALYYYSYRNDIVNVIFYQGVKCALKKSLRDIIFGLRITRAPKGFSKCLCVIRGILAGFLHYGHFARYISSQLNIK